MRSLNEPLNRRRFIERSLKVSGAGAIAGLSMEERTLLARADETAPVSGRVPSTDALDRGRIGRLQVSRLICGGNLFSGFAHSRDLTYVSSFMKQYFTPDKIMDTLQACEENGINTAILRCDQHIVGVLSEYRKKRGGKIQWIAQTYPSEKEPTRNIQLAIDHGAVGAFMQGGIGDRWVDEGKTDLVGQTISFVQKNGLIAGVGSHSLDVPKAVVKAGLEPDFFFKTINGVDYNSESPREVASYMKTVDTPWIAFKVLGAGVLEPEEGFATALKMGADFLNVGMFDFQIREDAELMKTLLAQGLSRERPWRA